MNLQLLSMMIQVILISIPNKRDLILILTPYRRQLLVLSKCVWYHGMIFNQGSRGPVLNPNELDSKIPCEMLCITEPRIQSLILDWIAQNKWQMSPVTIPSPAIVITCNFSIIQSRFLCNDTAWLEYDRYTNRLSYVTNRYRPWLEDNTLKLL